MPTDPHNLQRFLDAQATTYPQARAELARGEKRSHWMWFIFPQIRGLGVSPTAQRFAIPGRAEAVAYLAHTILGSRLRECTALVNAIQSRSLDEIFGYPDDLKFHSSVTLFAAVSADAQTAADDEQEPDNTVFAAALDKYFSSRPDPATRSRL